MSSKTRKSNSGYSLAELLVVVALVTILAALAIPGIARLGIFSRNELSRATRDLYAMLKAAQVFANTYNVETAVVYSPNDWDPCVPIQGQSGIQDSVTGEAVRCMIGAAMMYKASFQVVCNPRDPAISLEAFVPLAQTEGAFGEFAGRMTVIGRSPADGNINLYDANTGGWDLGKLGMTLQDTLPDLRPGLSGEERDAILCMAVSCDPDIRCEDPDNPCPRPRLPAHVFWPSGAMNAPTAKERYTLLVGPRPDETAEDRIADHDIDVEGEAGVDDVDEPKHNFQYQLLNNEGEDNNNLVSRKIYVYRSTGRVQIAD